MKTTTILMALMLTAAGIQAAEAANPEIKCQQSKLKAQGKLRSCLTKSAAGVLGGKADVSNECQTKFSEALTKIDGKAAAQGASCRYIDNGDGTVSDLDTGLMWEKKTDNNTIHDMDNPYQWTTGAPYSTTGTVFTTFLYALNGDTSSTGTSVNDCFAGYCDWRLPTIVELQTILVSPCSTGPCIDPTFGPTRADLYWSASTVAATPSNAWMASFASPGGITASVTKSSTVYARAVRGGL